MADDRTNAEGLGPLGEGDREEVEAREPVTPRREASVVLREGERAGVGEGGLLDPANQSLADALRITFRLVVGAMFVLAILFTLSGLRSVNEGERGIRVRSGAITGANLSPGFHLSWPYPIGELRSYARTPPQVELNSEFWFAQTGNPNRSYEQMARGARDRLTPGLDGAVVTAGLDLAHTKWTVQYVRDDVVDFATNILEEEEQELVKAAVQRGVVRATATTTLDELMKQSSDGSAIAARVQRVAQAMLDRLESGIELTRVTLDEKVVPLTVYTAYNRVAQADNQAARRLEDARAQRSAILTRVAGAAHEELTRFINEYERAVAIGDAAEQARILGIINDLLEGNRVELDGEVIAARTSGEVRQLIDRAAQHRTEVVAEAAADLARYSSLAEQFRDNPSVVISSQWVDAMSEFLNQETVQVMYLPAGLNNRRLLVNPDPDIEKEIDRRQREQGRERRERRTRAVHGEEVSAEPGG